MSGLSVVSVAAVVADVVSAPAAQAAQATGGDGKYRNMIQWVSWGAPGVQIPGKTKTVSETSTVAGQTLITTCTISTINASGGLESYRPGPWKGGPWSGTVDDVEAGQTRGFQVAADVPVGVSTCTFNVLRGDLS